MSNPGNRTSGMAIRPPTIRPYKSSPVQSVISHNLSDQTSQIGDPNLNIGCQTGNVVGLKSLGRVLEPTSETCQTSRLPIPDDYDSQAIQIWTALRHDFYQKSQSLLLSDPKDTNMKIVHDYIKTSVYRLFQSYYQTQLTESLMDLVWRDYTYIIAEDLFRKMQPAIKQSYELYRYNNKKWMDIVQINVLDITRICGEHIALNFLHLLQKTLNWYAWDPRLIAPTQSEPIYWKVPFSYEYTQPFIPRIQLQAGETLLLSSYLGTGKSVAGKIVIQYDNLDRALVMSSRQIFSYNITGELNSTRCVGDYELQDLGFVNYLDVMKEKNWLSYKRFVVSVESLHRMELKQEAQYSYDLVFIDEVESILRQFSSIETLGEHATQCYRAFEKLVTTAHRIIACDAFVTLRSYNVLQAIRGEVRAERNMWRPPERKCTEVEHLGDLIETLLALLGQGYKIFFFVGARTKAELIYDLVTERLPDIRKIMYTGRTNGKDKRDLTNVREIWILYDLVITTSTMTVGVNFDLIRPHFDYLFCYSSCMGSIVPDVFQALMRPRQIRCNKLYYTLYTELKMKRPATTMADITRDLRKTEMAIDESEVGRRLQLSWEPEEPWFHQLHKFNLHENAQSRVNHRQIFNNFLQACNYVKDIDPQIVQNDGNIDIDSSSIDLDTYQRLPLIDPQTAAEIFVRCKDCSDIDNEKAMLDKYIFHRNFEPHLTSLGVAYQHYWTKPDNRAKLLNIYSEKNRTIEELLRRESRKTGQIKPRCRTSAPKMEILNLVKTILQITHSCVAESQTYAQLSLVAPEILALEPQILKAFGLKELTSIKDPVAKTAHLINSILNEWSGNQFHRIGGRPVRKRINGQRVDVRPFKFLGVYNDGVCLWDQIRNQPSLCKSLVMIPSRPNVEREITLYDRLTDNEALESISYFSQSTQRSG
jgi:hypothetical protein